jgi:hypothetical protein
MPVQRKVFRIEETSSTRLALRDVSAERAQSPEISAEYSPLRALIEPRGDLDRPLASGLWRRSPRPRPSNASSN